MKHPEEHPLRWKTVVLKDHAVDPQRGMVIARVEFEVEDWWDRIGRPMSDAETLAELAETNWAVLHYVIRFAVGRYPHEFVDFIGDIDSDKLSNLGAMYISFAQSKQDEFEDCVYGKIDGLGHLVHIDELGEQV